MAYIGTDINYGNIAKQIATSSGSTTPTGALTYSVPSSESIMVMLDGVTQVPGTDFNVTSGTTLTFTTSVPSGVVVLVYFLGRSLDIGTPGASTVDSGQIVSGAIDEAHIANDAVNFATHLKAGTDGELITWDASGDPAAVAVGTATHVLTSNGAGAAPTFQAAAGGGITETDWWRLTADITATNADITANLERVDTPATSYLGTGMAESSGIFTFPSTGYWIIMVHGAFEGGSENSMKVNTLVTLNDSAYAVQAFAYSGQRNASITNVTGNSQLFLDVTSTTNVKVKFSTGSLGSGNKASGSTDATANFCNFMFIRLGDT